MTRIAAGHQRVKRLRRLSRSARERRTEGAFVLDGPRLIGEALAAGWELREAFVEPNVDVELRRALDESGVRCYELADGVLARVTDTVTPQPAAAGAPIVWAELDAPSLAGPGLLLTFAGLSDPGNAGTLVRTAEAVGARGVAAIGATVDLFSPKVVRSSAGAILRVPVVKLSESDAPDELHARGWQLVAAVPSGGQASQSFTWPPSTALVVGSEAHGIPDDLVAAADECVSIELREPVDSLNAAVAGSVLAFDWRRRPPTT